MSTHGARLVRLLISINPFHNTMHVKTVRTLTPYEWTIIARIFAICTTRVKGHTTNTTCVIVSYPFPNCHASITKLKRNSRGIDFFNFLTLILVNYLPFYCCFHVVNKKLKKDLKTINFANIAKSWIWWPLKIIKNKII